MLRHELLNVFVLNRALPLVDFLDLLRNNIHGDDFVMLGQKNCQRQSHISGSCYCDFHIDSLSYSSHLFSLQHLPGVVVGRMTR